MFGGINTETPSYDVIAKKDDYEIRRYYKQFIAQTTYNVSKNSDFLSETGKGFFPLFNFITGNNTSKTKISMTSPVIMQETECDDGVRRQMSFIMSPSTFKSVDQVPIPYDKNIEILEQNNARDMACITFNMSMSSKRNAEKENELRQAAARDGIQLSTNRDDVLILGYNPPYTIPYFRRNEICIPIINQ